MHAHALQTSLIAPVSRRAWVFALLLALTVVMMVLNLRIGSISYSVDQLVTTLLHPGEKTDLSYIVWNIRLPRTIAAVLGGAFLAVSGLLLQVYFRNPIVGPFILGISSGSTVMVSTEVDEPFSPTKTTLRSVSSSRV